MAAIIATTNDYWISAQALNITRNALGEPNRIQASVASGAQVMCYIKGIKPESEGPEYAGNGDGLEYDAGHNYRRWPLTVSPTYFANNEEKYIYIRIPRRASFATQAQVCFPSQLLDIYGRAVVAGEPGEQVGNVNYFYVWLRGRLSSSGDDGLTPRTWLSDVESGTLSTDEAISPTDTDWYTWNGIMQRVTFLKDIVMATGSQFLNLILNGKQLNSVATDSTTPTDSTTAVVTPKYVKDVITNRYLSRVDEDYAEEEIGFVKGLWIKAKNAFGITKDGDAKFNDTDVDGILRALAQVLTNKMTSQHYEGGWDNPFGSGFQMSERSTDHVSFLSVDNLFVRMKAVFTELEIRKISYAGGNIIFSHAGSQIVAVKPVYDTCDLEFDGTTAVLDGSAEFSGTGLHVNAGGAFDGTTLKFNDTAEKLVGYRCYLMKNDGTTATENWWRVDDQARCQTFNIDGTGTYHDVSNSFYWRRVMAVGVEQLEDGKDYDYVDLSVIDAIEGSTEPQAGDTIVQMGNRTDTERQGFISIQVAGEYAPSFEVYKGVNSYSLSGKRKICISPKYTEIRANKIVETTETGDYPLPHFRTDAWYTGMQCYYYDVVQHAGSSWLCIYPEGGIGGVPYTTEEPGESATYWRIFAKEGKTGGTPLTVYAWGTSDTEAPAISGNAYPPTGWSTRITDRPTGGDYYLWMAETMRHPDGTVDDWGTPACISGTDGTPGEDAKNKEYIYKYDANGYDGNTGEVSPSGAAAGSDTNKQQDDWVPNGWYDRALPVTESNPDVYMSSRKFDMNTHTWGAFEPPTVWGHYGQKGIDGDGVQYVYKLFDHELTDAERTSNIPQKPAQPNPQGEWIPTGWHDDPQAPTTQMQFCYCSIIKEIDGTWGDFEKLGLWSKWSEDGQSAAVALCTPQVVSIPTDTEGRILANFRQEIPVSMSTSSEQLSMFDVKILSGGANVELGPATLESHADSKTTFSGNTAVIGDASFSGTTLVMDDKGSTLVPKTLIVKGTAGAILTEHLCEIQVKAYDAAMNEYTAKTTITIQRNTRGATGASGADGRDGTDGADGTDAVNVSLTPQSVILTQNEAGAMPTLTDANTTVDVKQGEVDVTNQATIISATPSTYVVSGVTYNTCTCQISGKRVIITAIDQHGTETISGQTINKYAEQGYIDIVVRYKGKDTTVRFNFYCNLLGTWKREVVGDAETVAAQKVNYIYDPSNPNQVVKQSDYGEYKRSSSENLARLNSEVEDPSTGLITKTSELKQTADGLTSEVTQIKTGKNLLKGALSADGWYSESTIPYTAHPGMVAPVVDDEGWFNTAQSYHNFLLRSVTLTNGKTYVLSLYSKTTSSFTVTIWKSASSASDWSLIKNVEIPSGSSTNRRYVAFTWTGNTDTFLLAFPVKTLRYPQLEFGSTPTAFEVDSATETSSRISQSADHIEMKVKETGIDIDEKTIKLTAEKTTISGELTVPRVMNENADMVTTCEAGVVKVQSKSTASYGVFAINSLGEVVLQMYDKDGGLVLNLGGTPNTAVNGEWRAVKFKRVDSGGIIADTRENFTATDANCNMYYRLILGTIQNSGTVIQYYLPNGNQTTNQTVIGRDNRVFITRYFTESDIATGTFIPDGYYVDKNNGRFMQEMSEYFPDEGLYFVNVYHYESGKITEITKHYF